MMTGFGYDAHNVQPMMPSTRRSSQFFSGIGLSSSDQYGLTGDCFPSEGNTITPSTSVHMPRVSISDEELYEALNMSPVVHRASTSAYTADIPTVSDFAPSPIELNSLVSRMESPDYCYPSTSSMEQAIIPFENQAMFLPPDMISLGPSPTRDAASPAFSLHSFAPTTSTANADEEDLEVELINTIKPDQKFGIADDIDIFLHSGNSDNGEVRSSKDTTYSGTSSSNPTPSQRPPYAKKLSASSQKNSIDQTAIASTPVFNATSSPLFLQTSFNTSGFTPLLTPKSDALLKRKLSEASSRHQHPIQTTTARRESYPTTSQVASPRVSSNCYVSPPAHSAFVPSTSYALETPLARVTPVLDNIVFVSPPPGFEQCFPSLPKFESPDHRSPQHTTTHKDNKTTGQFRKYFIPEVASVEEEGPCSLTESELNHKSEELALELVEKLFCGPGGTPAKEYPGVVTSVEELFRSVKSNVENPKPAKRLSYTAALVPDRKMEQKPVEVAAVEENGEIDDWETADHDELTGKMEQLMKEVKKSSKVNESRTTMVAPSTSSWDPNVLSQVLEVFSIPDYKMQEDVVNAMESLGYGDAKLKWIERKIVLASFTDAKRAQAALTLQKHAWLRFRTLSQSPSTVQDAAKTHSAELTAPTRRGKTNASVARRMVENVLGQKSTVSVEKRKEERKQIADAKAAKKNTIKWD